MNFLGRVIELQTRFETAHGDPPNCIVLGPKEWYAFQHDIDHLLTPLKSDPEMRGTGKFFRGCRVLRTNETGMWVGRVVEPLK